MKESNVSINEKNPKKLTVETEPKVEVLRRHHETQPKLAFLPYVKWAAAGFLSFLFLACGVFSKLSVLSVAKCDSENGAQRGRRYIMLVLILMVPQFVGFGFATWGSIRKKNCPWPTRKGIGVCVMSSIFEVVGLSFFTMVAMTSEGISVSELIAVMMCVSMVPIMWQSLKTNQTEQLNTRTRKCVSFFCGLVQLAGFAIVIILADVQNVKVENCHYSLIPLILVSIAWLPKIRKLQCEPRLTEADLVDDEEILHWRTARQKATMICEGLKLFLTPFVSYLISWLFHKVYWSDIGDGFEYLGSNHDMVFGYFLANIFASFVGYFIAITVCSMAIQKCGFAFPITFMTPITFLIAVGCEMKWWAWDWLFDHEPNPSTERFYIGLAVFVTGFIAQSLSTTYYIWRSQDMIMARERQLFWVRSYNGVLLEQNLLLNRKNELTDDSLVNEHKRAKDSCIFICTTMYHEADYEMEQLLHSIRRVDIARQKSMRRIESHVWFDGAVKRNVLNSYVLQLISLVNKTLNVKVNACTKLETPYGMELRWRLPGGMHFHIHLKDNLKVKNKKRWSQVMYMSYVLDFKIAQMAVREEDTYILTTDADIKFDADSVEALLDCLMRDPNVGAVCGRTHPLGHGPLVWYQMFDYAIGHWFQKVANHVLGSVLCCPGCFSVYRAKALKDVLSEYSTTADHAVDFLTKDMGEDRWLCTLMVQAGWRLEYCAAAENHTYCPEDFDEFYKQRRRWIPSTLANLGLLISEYDITVKNNDTISFIFILYQAANVFSTLISPATVILLMTGGLQLGLNVNSLALLICLVIISLGFGLICLYTSQDFQLKTARFLTLIFALLMSAAWVGVVVQVVEHPEGKASPTTKPVTTHHYTLPTRPTTTTKKPPKNGLNMFALPDRFLPSSNIENTSDFKQNGFAADKTSPNTTSKPEESENLFLKFPPSSLYLFFLIGIFVVTAACHPTEFGCVLHGIWYLLCLPSGYLFLITYSVCNITDRSWVGYIFLLARCVCIGLSLLGTRENKAKTDSGESITKMITDKLIWLCRGCTDIVQEPASQPVQPVSELSSTSETSTESDSPTTTTSEDRQTGGETSEESTRTESEGTSEASSSSSLPYSPDKPKMKSALKKTSRPASPAPFRFPGEHDKRSVHFQAKLPTFKSHTPVGEWLEGKMKQYKGNFEENGYDDTSFISGMTEQELIDIGIDVRGHRKRLLREIEQLPFVELDNNVPDNVDKWLTDLGLHEYWLNFKQNLYDNPKALEDLKVMNADDLVALLHDDLEIWKSGHVKKLTLAIRKLQYPSTLERKIRDARQDMSKVPVRRLQDDGDGDEYEFWIRLRELRLLPESKAFGQYAELANKLGELRNSAVLLLLVANAIWIILAYLLAQQVSLQVESSNPLGLVFIIVFSFLVFVQFLTMLWHRMSTLLHFIARAPFRPGEGSLKGWSFNDNELPPPPTEDELRKIRDRRLRRSKKWRSSRDSLLQSGEFDESGEHAPLINGTRPGSSYQATTSRSRSPHPV